MMCRPSRNGVGSAFPALRWSVRERGDRCPPPPTCWPAGCGSRDERGVPGMSAANTGGSPPREQRISAAFVELADTLVANFDLAAFLYRLTWHCVDLLQADRAGASSRT